VERFVEQVLGGFWTSVPFYRVIRGFLVQFGIAVPPSKNKQWLANYSRFADDVNLLGTGVDGISSRFRRGYVSYAGGGPNSRDLQVFIAFQDNSDLGHAPWETPIGMVNEASMSSVIDRIYSEYGDMSEQGNPRGIDPHRLEQEGAAYLKASFPKMTSIKNCRLMFNATKRLPPRIQRQNPSSCDVTTPGCPLSSADPAACAFNNYIRPKANGCACQTDLDFQRCVAASCLNGNHTNGRVVNIPVSRLQNVWKKLLKTRKISEYSCTEIQRAAIPESVPSASSSSKRFSTLWSHLAACFSLFFFVNVT